MELCALPDAIYKAYKKVLPPDKINKDAEAANDDKASSPEEEDAQ